MDVGDVAVGLPVGDMGRAAYWYRRVFRTDAPDPHPAADSHEFRVGPVWLHLHRTATTRSGAEVSVSFQVADAAAEHRRLSATGVEVGPLRKIPGVVCWFTVTDPDGNVLGFRSDLDG